VTSIESRAFSTSFKLLATLLTSGCVGWLFQLERAGLLGDRGTVTMGWFWAASGMMGWTWWAIIRSKTVLTDDVLRQSWLWDKQISRTDMAYAKLIRVNGLNWLIAPRLYVRTLDGKFAVFYAADAPMIQAFEALKIELEVRYARR
jgi:hypothetical protein